jgi:hypothetical protein
VDLIQTCIILNEVKQLQIFRAPSIHPRSVDHRQHQHGAWAEVVVIGIAVVVVVVVSGTHRRFLACHTCDNKDGQVRSDKVIIDESAA